MQNTQELIRQVYAAKEDAQAADRFICAYLPFIRAETARFLCRPPVEGQDDELSIAMIAFYEAIRRYSRVQGAFLRYASLLIRSRLIDFCRRERRHAQALSLEQPLGGDGPALADTLADRQDLQEEVTHRTAAQREIEALCCQIRQFGAELSDVADNCPRQQRTLDACRRALQCAKEHPELLDALIRTKRLPLGQLAALSGVERKTLERHRKYMIALLLIQTNGYEIIRGHIKQVLRGGSAR